MLKQWSWVVWARTGQSEGPEEQNLISLSFLADGSKALHHFTQAEGLLIHHIINVNRAPALL